MFFNRFPFSECNLPRSFIPKYEIIPFSYFMVMLVLETHFQPDKIAGKIHFYGILYENC